MTYIDTVNIVIERTKARINALRSNLENALLDYVVNGNEAAFADAKVIDKQIYDCQLILRNRAVLQQRALLKQDSEDSMVVPTPCYWKEQFEDKIMDLDAVSTMAELEAFKPKFRAVAVEANCRQEAATLLDSKEAALGGR